MTDNKLLESQVPRMPSFEMYAAAIMAMQNAATQQKQSSNNNNNNNNNSDNNNQAQSQNKLNNSLSQLNSFFNVDRSYAFGGSSSSNFLLSQLAAQLASNNGSGAFSSNGRGNNGANLAELTAATQAAASQQYSNPLNYTNILQHQKKPHN